MLVRRRSVLLQPMTAAAMANRERANPATWFDDLADGAYWGGADLVFEGP